MKCPNFLCIGLPKTGTTWLYVHLRKHPEVWLPPVKEISFLWGYDKRVFSHSELFRHRKYVFKKKIRYLKQQFLDFGLTGKNLDSIVWDLNYVFRPQTISWYQTLYAKETKLLKGDISPQYHYLEEIDIQKIKTINPNMKIIILLRNPMDRLWSFARMKLVSSGSSEVNGIDEQACVKFIDQGLKECPNYWKMIELWRTYFPSVFIGYYDDLMDNPELLFMKILKFLEVDYQPKNFKRTQLESKVWEGAQLPMPKNIRKYLNMHSKQVIEELFVKANHEHVNTWMNSYS